MPRREIDPVGVSDIANRLGVRKQTVATWRWRGLLPEPEWTVSNLAVWDWPTIEAWAKETGRLDAQAKILLRKISLTK